MRPKRVFSIVRSIVFALILSPILGFICGALWYTISGQRSGGIVACVVGVSVFVLVVWKSDGIFRRLLNAMCSSLPESICSYIEFGVTGGLLIGGLMLSGILLLGHARPAGWEFDRILPAAGLGFLFFGVVRLLFNVFRPKKSPPDI